MNPDGQMKESSPRDAMRLVLCPQVIGCDHHHWKCVCRHCEDCPDFQVHAEENGTDDNDSPKISFHEYRTFTRCSMHKGIPLESRSGPCPLCTDPGYTGKRGKISSKQELTKDTKPIGIFMTKHFQPALEAYVYHYSHVKILGKGVGQCGYMRYQMFLDGKGMVTSEIRDYAERQKANFALEIQSGHFGDQASVSMEGASVKYFKAEDVAKVERGAASWGDIKVEHEYHGHFSDDSRQDAATTHAHELKLLTYLWDKDAICRRMNGGGRVQ